MCLSGPRLWRTMAARDDASGVAAVVVMPGSMDVLLL
jgi:hypothetical protein